MKETNDSAEVFGTVLEIQRMSTEDGPGLRTTVFMKGCPLHCEWCHNPESISSKPQPHWIKNRCIGCKKCVESCPLHALAFGPQGVTIDRERCCGCGTCAGCCPTTAMELWGTRREASELASELARDRAYFEASGGGVTLSGGESTMQREFAQSLLAHLRGMGIHTALDTCGLCSGEVLDSILPFTDLVLYDIKEIDPVRHRAFTGSDNRRILENLDRIAQYKQTHLFPRQLWVRTPIIPGATDTEENITGIGAIISKLPETSVERWELCAFNNLCRDKYEQLGLDWRFAHTPLISSREMERIAEIARKSVPRPKIVMWSGSTLAEDEHERGEGPRAARPAARGCL